MTEAEFTALYMAQRDNVTRFSVAILVRNRVPNAEVEAEAICADVFVEALEMAHDGRTVNRPYLLGRSKSRSIDFVRSLEANRKFISRLQSMAYRSMGD